MVVKAGLVALIVAIGCLWMESSAFGGEPPLSVAEIAEIFGYPADKLKVRDETEEINRRASAKGRRQIMSSHRFSGVDNTFAPITLYVARDGLLLTDEVKGYADKMISKSEEGGTKTDLRRLKFGDIGTGISGLGMAGPGGSGETAMMTMPKQKTDVGISMMIPGDPPLSVLPEAGAYFELVTGAGVRERLVVCLNRIASKAAGRPIEAAEVK